MAGFDAAKARFWDDEFAEPPATEERIRTAERELGVTLPEELTELLRLHDGGGVADHCNAFPVAERTSWSDDHIPFECVMGVGEDESRLSMLDPGELPPATDFRSFVEGLTAESAYHGDDE
ncbi:SMI1/KNR4 family protein [Allokutzneria albata]|uniref:SMI1 / KNR4 family (SUKH-1) n=1 Tax=Allokutzneria albata TaxID=211114 RepID=A0A1G9UJ09_ALLAB|nr:SMI1/KNR4 family protein [Allokutzneria albata]SDM59912.1 SMI1 / KNR4 family (SUKH-1) [Allokutzneria albata]